jgi:hypothetical protein
VRPRETVRPCAAACGDTPCFRVRDSGRARIMEDFLVWEARTSRPAQQSQEIARLAARRSARTLLQAMATSAGHLTAAPEYISYGR